MPEHVCETSRYAKRWRVDRDGRVNGVRDDRGRMTHHVLPVLGPFEGARFTRDDVERLRDDFDAKIADGFSRVGPDALR
jgi:hypothetical protein